MSNPDLWMLLAESTLCLRGCACCLATLWQWRSGHREWRRPAEGSAGAVCSVHGSTVGCGRDLQCIIIHVIRGVFAVFMDQLLAVVKTCSVS